MAPTGSNKPFQLLEINLISGQDLEPIYKKMRTYAKAWVHPNRKLSSCVDTEGNNNPTWNDKFVFRVDESFLKQDTSAVMIEIYTTHWFRDVLVGTVRVLVGNLIPPTVRAGVRQSNHIGMRFVALQIRRPSGRPQGILNIGVTVLDSSLRSMPLYNDFASAVGYRDLMQDPPNLQHSEKRDNDGFQPPSAKPVLRRSRSERSDFVFDDFTPGSSMVGLPITKPAPKDGSILSISEFVDPFASSKKGKASSIINGAELVATPKLKGKKKGKASSMVNGEEVKKPRQKGKRGGKASSMVSPAFPNKESPILKIDEVPIQTADNVKSFKEESRPTMKSPTKPAKVLLPLPAPAPAPQREFIKGGRFKGSSILSGSEIGPSPSEVAGMMAERRYPLDDNQSSVLDGWSLDESVEGLKSKLERWRTELPPLYDHHGYSSPSYKSSNYSRKRSEKDAGLFSCFGNICGYECQCVCGKPPGRKSNGGRYSSSNGSTGSRSTFL